MPLDTGIKAGARVAIIASAVERLKGAPHLWVTAVVCAGVIIIACGRVIDAAATGAIKTECLRCAAITIFTGGPVDDPGEGALTVGTDRDRAVVREGRAITVDGAQKTT